MPASTTLRGRQDRHLVYQQAQFLLNFLGDRKPVLLLQSGSYMTTQLKVKNSCCTIFDSATSHRSVASPGPAACWCTHVLVRPLTHVSVKRYRAISAVKIACEWDVWRVYDTTSCCCGRRVSQLTVNQLSHRTQPHSTVHHATVW